MIANIPLKTDKILGFWGILRVFFQNFYRNFKYGNAYRRIQPGIQEPNAFLAAPLFGLAGLRWFNTRPVI